VEIAVVFSPTLGGNQTGRPAVVVGIGAASGLSVYGSPDVNGTRALVLKHVGQLMHHSVDGFIRREVDRVKSCEGPFVIERENKTQHSALGNAHIAPANRTRS